jgi:hypothetical protein
LSRLSFFSAPPKAHRRKLDRQRRPRPDTPHAPRATASAEPNPDTRRTLPHVTATAGQISAAAVTAGHLVVRDITAGRSTAQ